MIHLIVGHRGSGKTTFLKRIQAEYEALKCPCLVYDLDQEIESRTQTTVHEIFEHQGELVFRNIEQKILWELIAENRNKLETVFIALGAGYNREIPPGVEVLWLRRPTDRVGRIFVDRPRLDRDLTPLDEYLNRFDQREDRFRRIYNKMITIPEGWTHINEFETQALGLKPANLQYSVTIMPEVMESPLRLEIFIQEKLQLGVRYFELRSDLLSDKEIFSLLNEIPKERVLLSFRSELPSASLMDLKSQVHTDWAVELGPCPFEPTYASLHNRLDGETVDQASERLLGFPAKNWKLAIPIDNFTELWVGHRFYTTDIERRSFLPQSHNGRWSWYRRHVGSKMKLNFFRDGEGSSLDQPYLMDVLQNPAGGGNFAAVLGSPIIHSHTPAEQFEFFRARRMPVYAIDMEEDECTALNLSVLTKLGLRAAAVTSPLKEATVGLCSQLDRRAEELQSVNTLVYNELQSGWVGANTDVIGFEKILEGIQLPPSIVVWGGGGTRSTLKKLLPQAAFYSARLGEPILKSKAVVAEESPELLIWGVPRPRMLTAKTPPKDWRPKYILDLNYNEDSPGREYALSVGATYISGKGFFKAQAAEQREFWSRLISNETTFGKGATH